MPHPLATRLLRQQHQRAAELLAELAATTVRDPERREALRELVVAALRHHALVEEELIYARLEHSPDFVELVHEAYREHEQIKEIVGELERCRTDEEDFGDLVAELRWVLDEHVEIEEAELLPRLEATLSRALNERLGETIERELTAASPPRS